MAKKNLGKIELKDMNVLELKQFKDIVYDICESYDKRLSRYNVCDFNTYLQGMTTEEKNLIEKRLRIRKLYDYITSLIEEKIEEYYV